MLTSDVYNKINECSIDEVGGIVSEYVRSCTNRQEAASILSRAAFLPLEEGENPDEWEIMGLQDLIDYSNKTGGIQWLIPNMLAAGCIHIVSCAPGGTKSWLMLEIARAFVSEDLFMGTVPVEQRRVLYIDEEMGGSKMSARVRKMEFAAGAPFFYMGMQHFRLDVPAQLERLKAVLKEREIDIVFFDTLTRIHGVRDENDNAAMRVVFQTLSQITAMGVTVVVAHHDRKRGGDDTIAHERMRGAQEIGAMADMAFACERIGEGMFRLQGTKTRLIPEEDKISIDYVVADTQDRARTSVRAVEMSEVLATTNKKKFDRLHQRIIDLLAGGPLTTNEIATRACGDRNSILVAIKTLKESGEIISTKRPGRGGGNVYSLPLPSSCTSILNADSLEDTAIT